MIQRPTYFELFELVCPDVFKRYGDIAWGFFDSKLLVTLDQVRNRLNKSIIINNWHNEGEFTQRGFRCIQCQLVQDAVKNNTMYVSPHMTGQAADFDVEGLLAEEVRQWLYKNQNLLPYPIRLESGVNWVHLDIRDNFEGAKIIFFNS
jgi:hypothetical protein